MPEGGISDLEHPPSPGNLGNSSFILIVDQIKVELAAQESRFRESLVLTSGMLNNHV